MKDDKYLRRKKGKNDQGGRIKIEMSENMFPC